MTRSLVRVGVIGAGNMGQAYTRVLRQSDLRFRAEVVAVCDQDLARARQLAGPQAGAWDDVAQMLAEQELDWVYQATPDHAHKEPFLALMAAGVPTLVEKPLATTLEDALAMSEAASRAGVQAQVNFTNRINPAFVQAKAAVEAGQVGRPLGVYARLSNVFTYPKENLSWAARSSVAWFLISHTADLAAWLTGWRATSVLAHGVKGKLAQLGVDTWDLIQALVTYEDGGSALLEASWTLPASMPSIVDFEFVVHGDDGQIAVDTTRQMVTVAGPAKYAYPGTLGWTQRQISDSLDRLEAPAGGDPLGDGLANTALLVALHDSLRSGRPEPVREF
ncbi:MAG: Gfo/Idh/MocA family oxidoreductase [Propionibacteriaceae bacterium]|jgi:predicted dehydrogenase|nr:Gfo/Idh/MocA family oxidoreductase [Propionibacteriaceae bacterium]